MKRASLVLILAIFLAIGCDTGGSGRSSSSTQSPLESAVASGATSFDFAADPTLAWDRMFVFDCYSSQAEVEKALGFKWAEFSQTTIASSDGVVLVTFIQNGKVVDWYEQPRLIDLSWLANDIGYSRAEARFKIERAN